jgi:hypothetical protein
MGGAGLMGCFSPLRRYCALSFLVHGGKAAFLVFLRAIADVRYRFGSHDANSFAKVVFLRKNRGMTATAASMPG